MIAMTGSSVRDPLRLKPSERVWITTKNIEAELDKTFKVGSQKKHGGSSKRGVEPFIGGKEELLMRITGSRWKNA